MPKYKYLFKCLQVVEYYIEDIFETQDCNSLYFRFLRYRLNLQTVKKFNVISLYL